MDFQSILDAILKVVNADNIESCIALVEKLIALAQEIKQQQQQKSS